MIVTVVNALYAIFLMTVGVTFLSIGIHTKFEGPVKWNGLFVITGTGLICLGVVCAAGLVMRWS